MATVKPVFYNAWFCPFAQRAWIGILHRQIDCEIKEQDPYDKSPEWLAINPRGLVPTLIHNDRSVYESTILLEYLDEAWPDHEGANIMPDVAFQRFKARAWGDHISKKLVPNYYRSLQLVATEREDAKKQLLTELSYMFENACPQGPYFLGDSPGYVDFMLIPFAIRFELILGHYRNFTIPENTYARYYTWYEALLKLDCVKKTLADKKSLIGSYQRYADNTAKSHVAVAIRKGKALP